MAVVLSIYLISVGIGATGNAGALCFLPQRSSVPVIIINGDILTTLDARLLAEVSLRTPRPGNAVRMRAQLARPVRRCRCRPARQLSGDRGEAHPPRIDQRRDQCVVTGCA